MTQFDKTTDNYIANIKKECKDVSNTEKWINILKSSKSDSLIEFGQEYFNVDIKPNYVTKTSENSELQDNIYVIRIFGKKENYIKVGYSSNMKGRMEDYKALNPLCEIIDTFYIDNGKDYEQIFHSYNMSAFKREWYKEDDLDMILKTLKAASMGNINFENKTIKYTAKLEDLYQMFLEAEDREAYELEYPEFIEYEQYLTVQEMNTARWNKKKIDKLLFDKKLLRVAHKRVCDLIAPGFVSSADVKQLYARVFTELKIALNAKGTLIEDNKFMIVESARSMVNGKQVRGYEISKLVYIN